MENWILMHVLQLVLSGIAGYPYRQSDIDDVILNTLSAFLGYAVFLAARAIASLARRPEASA